MSTSDVLKAALEKKKQKNSVPNKKDKQGANKDVPINQVIVNRPQKKSTGRGG